MTVYVKDWFFDKMRDERSGVRLHNSGSEVIGETEKAYKIEVSYTTRDGERDGVTTMWCPKSCALSSEEYRAAIDAEAERYEDGCKAYDAMIKFAQENGIKGVRVGLRKATILKKIQEAGLDFIA